jgi:phosphoglycolate phosphatase
VKLPRALVFDWDNTLVDSWATIHEALVLTFEAMDHKPWSFEETKLKVRQSLRDAFPALFGDRWDEARKLYLDHFTAIHLGRLSPIEGAAELLVAAKKAGFHIAVLSNKTGRILRSEVTHLGWDAHFVKLVGAGDAAADKPDPVAMQHVLEGSGFAGPDVWYIGDTAIDMECAARAGCVGVLIGALDLQDEGFKRYPPDLQFADVTSFARHLARSPNDQDQAPSASEIR